MTDSVFSTRFGQLFNSLYLVTQLRRDTVGSVHEPESPHIFDCTNNNATVFHDERVYEAGHIWIASLTVACIILLICCFVTLYIHQWVLVPDVFGFVATSANENPSFARYPVGSYMDGWERARALGDINVRFGDVTPHEARGKLALLASESTTGHTNLLVRKQGLSQSLFG